MALITLTTDFGLRNPDLGYLKSRILQSVPAANLVDISHEILPFDTDQAVYIVKNGLKDFPERTIHLIGLDSETHTENYPVLAVAGEHFYLGQDNGILPAALEGTDFKMYRLPFDKPGVFMQEHIDAIQKIVKGIAPENFAELTQDYRKIKLSKPLLRYDEKSQKVSLITPKVIYNDNYGNAIFNLMKDEFEQWRDGRKFRIDLERHFSIDKIQDYYNDIDTHQLATAAGNMYARFNHFGYFEIYVYKSNSQTGGADKLLMLRKNKIVNIIFE